MNYYLIIEQSVISHVCTFRDISMLLAMYFEIKIPVNSGENLVLQPLKILINFNQHQASRTDFIKLFVHICSIKSLLECKRRLKEHLLSV